VIWLLTQCFKLISFFTYIFTIDHPVLSRRHRKYPGVIYNIIIPIVYPSFCATRKYAPFMGVLAAAGCAWSARGEPGYAEKWAGLDIGAVFGRHAAGRIGLCASNGGFLNGRCASTAGFLTLQFKPQSSERDCGLLY